MTEESADLGLGAEVPANERPVKSRTAARVVVHARGAFLMEGRFDPHRAEESWLTAPGGGMDPGEDPLTAAARELHEELGVEVPAAELVGPVATRLVVHGYTDQITRQHETYFLWDAGERFEPHAVMLTAREQLTSGETRWFEPSELEGQWLWDDVVALWGLRDHPERWVVDLGEQELSVVPVQAA